MGFSQFTVNIAWHLLCIRSSSALCLVKACGCTTRRVVQAEVAAGEARLAASPAAARQLHSLATGLLGASAAGSGQGAAARAGAGALTRTLQPSLVADAGGVGGGRGSVVAPARALQGLGTL